MRTSRAAVAVLAALAAVSCGGGAPAAHSRHAAAYASPQCPLVLSRIPAHPPATADQAGVVARALSTDQGIGRRIPRGTPLRSLTRAVGTAAFRLVFDLAGATASARADLSAYNADVARLRAWCRRA